MANRTAWTAGNGAGLTFASIFGSGDLTSLANTDSVLSSAAAIANGTNLDMFADVSVEITISSSTPSTGAYMGLWIAALGEDGSTYGDGHLTAGTAAAYTPPWPMAGSCALAAVATTKMVAYFQNILLPPNSFKFVLLNATGVTFSATAANNAAQLITYNVNLNN